MYSFFIDLNNLIIHCSRFASAKVDSIYPQNKHNKQTSKYHKTQTVDYEDVTKVIFLKNQTQINGICAQIRLYHLVVTEIIRIFADEITNNTKTEL